VVAGRRVCRVVPLPASVAMSPSPQAFRKERRVAASVATRRQGDESSRLTCFVACMLLLPAGSRGADDCYCDRWYSTNTRTLDFPVTRSFQTAGMSYRGPRNTTFNGIECLPWAEAFDRCCTGFEQESYSSMNGVRGPHYKQLVISQYMSHLSPDKLGLEGHMIPKGLFDNDHPKDYERKDSSGNNQCRMPSFREAWLKGGGSLMLYGTLSNSMEELGYMPSLLATLGPFCFVNAADPRAIQFIKANGWSWGNLGEGQQQSCPEVTPVPCGVPRCKVDTVAGASVGCVPAAAAAAIGPTAAPQQTRLLFANGGFELWVRRTNMYGAMRNAAVMKNPPASWADVTYQMFPAYPKGANPPEPRFWDLCIYEAMEFEKMGVDYNSSLSMRVDHLLHKLGARVLCDPVLPRAQGISLNPHAPGRDGASSYAARMEFLKANYTAAVASENGAVASLVPGVLHVARAWVRCVKGSATVALVVSSLPETARMSGNEQEKQSVALTYYDALPNITLGSDGPKNVLRCQLEPSTYTNNTDASESVSGWTQLEVAVRSPKAAHEVVVQLIIHSHSDNAAILIDDASLEAETTAATPARTSTPSDGSDASSVFPAYCSGGGGGGVSYSASHRCSTDPTRLFYRIREKGGVPVAFEQVHAMVRLGYRSIQCRKPDLDFIAKAECPHLSEATLPHLSVADVKTYMDTLSDADIVSLMGWNDVNARGPGVGGDASIAVRLLREGLPVALETGVVRVVDGPEYNIPMSPSDNPALGPMPTLGIMWHTLSSTTSFDVYDTEGLHWRMCSHHQSLRKALCYLWAEVSYTLGCGLLHSLLDLPGWEEYVTFEGYFSSGDLVNDHYVKFLQPIVTHFSDVKINGDILCYSTASDLFDQMKVPPPQAYGIGYIETTINCINPLSRRDTINVLALVLPLVAPKGTKCINLLTLDFDEAPIFTHHKDSMVRGDNNSATTSVTIDAPATGSGDSKNLFDGPRLVPSIIILIISSSLMVAVAGCVLRKAWMRSGPPLHGGIDRKYLKDGSGKDRTPRNILKDGKISDKVLGEGAEGRVFLGEFVDGGTIRQIATKMYHTFETGVAEIYLYEDLPSHENILRVFGCYMDLSTMQFCVAMEYCRHGSIRQCMHSGSFPRNWAFLHRVVTEIIGAMSTVHGANTVHRDIKLDNVLLCCPCEDAHPCSCLSGVSRDTRDNARNVHAKVADFGMAKKGMLNNMSSGNVRGTLMYIPPERVTWDQENHCEDFYVHADIYAMGLFIWETLYYMHHGQSKTVSEAVLPSPHDGRDLLICIKNGKFNPPCDFLPNTVQTFLKGCYNVDPLLRFQSMKIVMEEWAKMLGPLSLIALTASSDDDLETTDGHNSMGGSMSGDALLSHATNSPLTTSGIGLGGGFLT